MSRTKKTDTKNQIADSVESVGIMVRMKDGRSREYPLEVWQVWAMAQILGFQVHFPDLEDYRMSDEQIVSAKMDVFCEAAKKLPMDNWSDYWEDARNKEKT